MSEINWQDKNLIDTLKKDPKKLQHIHANAEKLINQQRETFETHVNKATSLLITNIALLTAILTFIRIKDNSVFWNVYCIVFSILLVISALFFVSVLRMSKGSYTYTPPIGYVNDEHFKKEDMDTVLYMDIKRFHKLIRDNGRMFEKNAKKFNLGLYMFAFSPIISFLITFSIFYFVF